MGTLIINLTFNRKGNITIVYIRLLTHFELYYIYFFFLQKITKETLSIVIHTNIKMMSIHNIILVCGENETEDVHHSELYACSHLSLENSSILLLSMCYTLAT